MYNKTITLKISDGFSVIRQDSLVSKPEKLSSIIALVHKTIYTKIIKEVVENLKGFTIKSIIQLNQYEEEISERLIELLVEKDGKEEKVLIKLS
jgi:hypothetical protein